MRRYPLPILTALLLLSAPISALYAQAPPAAPAAPVAERSKSLNALFHNYWEEYLKTSPEFASSIGDKRYDDQLTDYSVKAINQWLAAEQNFLLQLAAIDPDGLSDQEKTSRDGGSHSST